jgi:hypothetical protein
MAKKQDSVEPKQEIFCKDCDHRVNNITEAYQHDKDPGYCLIKGQFCKRKDKTCDSFKARKKKG